MKLISKKNSQYWWYDFTVRGQRYRGSTKETNEYRAEKIASVKLAAALDATDPLAKKAPTLRKFSERFLDWVDRSRLDDDTKTYYQNGWRMLAATKLAGMRLDLINHDAVDPISFAGGSANTNRALRTLRRMLHKAEDWKVLCRAPKLKLAQEHARSLRLNEAMESKLLAGASDCNWRPRTLQQFTDVVMLMRDTGMRDERELYQVRIERLDFERRVIFVPESKTVNGRREIPMTSRAEPVLRRLCGERTEGWLFPSKRSKSGHLTTIAKRFQQAREKAGLPGELVLYCGRHDFGTRLYAHTKNLKLVMEVMGHKDVKTAMRYQHPDLELARAALENSGSVTGGA